MKGHYFTCSSKPGQFYRPKKHCTRIIVRYKTKRYWVANITFARACCEGRQAIRFANDFFPFNEYFKPYADRSIVMMVKRFWFSPSNLPHFLDSSTLTKWFHSAFTFNDYFIHFCYYFWINVLEYGQNYAKYNAPVHFSWKLSNNYYENRVWVHTTFKGNIHIILIPIYNFPCTGTHFSLPLALFWPLQQNENISCMIFVLNKKLSFNISTRITRIWNSTNMSITFRPTENWNENDSPAFLDIQFHGANVRSWFLMFSFIFVEL